MCLRLGEFRFGGGLFWDVWVRVGGGIGGVSRGISAIWLVIQLVSISSLPSHSA